MTAANSEEADRIASMLVETRLAACAQILPAIKSVYRWKGEITRDNEILLLAKTVHGKFDELDRAVRAIHSYETPEIVCIEIAAGSVPYLDWLRSEVERDPDPRNHTNQH
ncbi:MAG: divalent-cation tolerance protein CutA [Acidobacteriota bacterium]